jgi:hypothetical protein
MSAMPSKAEVDSEYQLQALQAVVIDGAARKRGVRRVGFSV